MGSFRLFGHCRFRSYHINLAVKGVAEVVVVLGSNDVEQKVTVFAERPVRVGNAHAVLAATVAAFRLGIDLRQKLPAVLFEVHSSAWLRVEAFGRAIAYVKLLDLRPARVGMP